MRVQYGFGSAGSSRSLRATASAVGVGQTAKNYRKEKHAPDAKLDNPNSEELREALRCSRCWWCDREGFISILGHIGKAHGIYRQEVRRMAGLTKYGEDARVCTPELTATLRCRVNQNLNAFKSGAAMLHALKKPRNLSDRAKEINREKLVKAWALPNAQETRRLAAQKAGEASRARTQGHPCPSCGVHVHLSRHRTCCKPECVKEMKRRNGIAMAHHLKSFGKGIDRNAGYA